jgi:hypothetical protein
MEKASPPRKRSDSASLLRADERRGRVVRMLVLVVEVYGKAM